MMKIATTIKSLRRELMGHSSVSFVPTMGGLHEGHLSLVRIARNEDGPVVVSIFVNRLQFSVHEDFDLYPRSYEEDIYMLEKAGADVIFIPDETEIYPEPQDFFIRPSNYVSTVLEGKCRPDFFAGVSTVVLKLLSCVAPRIAFFGEKDYQQLLVVQKMVRQFCLPVIVKGVPTIRDESGLALSSRNRYLSISDRKEAVSLYLELYNIISELKQGNQNYLVMESIARMNLIKRGWFPDYIAIRRSHDLEIPQPGERSLVVLGAAKLGDIRLIDNIKLDL